MSAEPFTEEELAVARTLTIDEATSRWVKPDGSHPTDREAAAAVWSKDAEAEPEIALTLTNFPPNGDRGEIRTVAFGPMGPMQLLLQVHEPEPGDEVMKVDIVVSNAANNDEVGDFLLEAAEVLQAVAERASEKLIEAAAELRAAEEQS